MIQVSSVETAPDYGLLLTFNDGSLRRFDMRPYLLEKKLGHPHLLAAN